jgi:hypothetical protein
MPHNDHAPACKIANELIRMRVWEVVESGARLKISCDNCHHETTWTQVYMEKRLRKWKGKTFGTVAVKLRCGGCRSNYVRVWRG